MWILNFSLWFSKSIKINIRLHEIKMDPSYYGALKILDKAQSHLEQQWVEKRRMTGQ